jgi:hypothetical protein
VGGRWYRFADEGFGVRAGFREHRLYFYAYEDVLRVERVSEAAAPGTADVWVTLRRRRADGRPVEGPACCVVVIQGVEEWEAAGGGGARQNTLLEFLRLQAARARLRSGQGVLA